MSLNDLLSTWYYLIVLLVEATCDSVFQVFTSIFKQTLPRLVDSPSLENIHAKNISCGARHTALVTGIPSYTCLYHFNSCLIRVRLPLKSFNTYLNTINLNICLISLK